MEYKKTLKNYINVGSKAPTVFIRVSNNLKYTTLIYQLLSEKNFAGIVVARRNTQLKSNLLVVHECLGVSSKYVAWELRSRFSIKG